MNTYEKKKEIESDIWCVSGMILTGATNSQFCKIVHFGIEVG